MRGAPIDPRGAPIDPISRHLNMLRYCKEADSSTPGM